MNKSLKGITTGLKAAAKSLITKSTKFKVGNICLACPVCGHDEFDRREMQINTSGMTFMGMDWLNESACALVCRQCKRIELFAENPSEQ